MRRLVPFLLVLVLLTSPGGRQAWWRLPDRHNPWAPLHLAQPPSWLTRWKLAAVEREPGLCQALLRQTEWTWRPLPDRRTGPGCGFSDAVMVSRTELRVNAPFALSCRAALSLALWERHVVQPAARATYGQPVAALHHLGSYACRDIRGREGAGRSQHATADALDVDAFTLRDGTRVSVAGDWAGQDRGAAFLRRVHRGGCEVFDGALGPAYNRAHADHLHLERGGYRVCR